MLIRLFRFLNQFLNYFIQRRSAGRTCKLVADHSFGIDYNQRWPAANAPLFGNGTGGAASVPKRPPRDLLEFHNGLQFFIAAIAVDAEENERLVLHTLHERPLMREHGPARAS